MHISKANKYEQKERVKKGEKNKINKKKKRTINNCHYQLYLQHIQ